MNPESGSTPRVLVAEDDEEISRLLVQLLQRSKIETVAVFDGLEILTHLKSTTFDLLLLDLQMPGKHGLSVLKELRSTSDIPVIILTALSEEKDRIAGLELGADDYVVKPFYPTEVLLRVKNLIKRRVQIKEPISSVIQVGPLSCDSFLKKITMDGVDLELTGFEFDIVMALIRNSGKVMDRQTLSRIVAGDELPNTTRRMDMKISQIRRKFGEREFMIRTVWGAGYEFVTLEKS